jgi:hypothetical protein
VNVWKAAAVLACLAGAAACERVPRAEANTISEDRFIGAYVALSAVAGDTAVTDSLRAVILAEHGVTEEEMRAFVAARSHDPQRLAAVWDQIRERLQQMTQEDVTGDEELNGEVPGEYPTPDDVTPVPAEAPRSAQPGRLPPRFSPPPPVTLEEEPVAQ